LQELIVYKAGGVCKNLDGIMGATFGV